MKRWLKHNWQAILHFQGGFWCCYVFMHVHILVGVAHADAASDFLDALRAHGKPVVGATLGGGYQLCSMIRAGADPAALGGVWAFYAPEAQQYLCPDTLHR